MTHRDRPCGPSGRREAAGDAGHRQDLPTPSDGPRGRPERRLAKAFGQRRAWLAMPRIATPHAPCRKPWQTVPTGHYHRPLVFPSRLTHSPSRSNFRSLPARQVNDRFLFAVLGLEFYPGAVAEWLRSGLQNRVHRFDSGPRLQSLIRRSSVGRTVDC